MCRFLVFCCSAPLTSLSVISCAVLEHALHATVAICFTVLKCAFNFTAFVFDFPEFEDDFDG